MATVTMDRLDEIATAWRRGLDAGDLTNPAGPVFTEETYVDYDITATGGFETWFRTTNMATYLTIQNCDWGQCLCCTI